MSFQRWKPLEFVYEYDHAIDGGLIGDINLRLIGNNPMNEQTTINGVTLYFFQTFVGNSTPSVTLGNSSDRDGFFVDFFALAQAGSVLRNAQLEGAFLWDHTAKNEKVYKPSSAAVAVPSITIANYNVVAGKFRAVFTAVRMD